MISRGIAPVCLGLALAITVGASLALSEWSGASYRAPPADWPAPTIDAGVGFIEFGPLPLVETAGERQIRRAHLGERLFHDRALSAQGDKACADCHRREFGWGGPQPVHGARNAPSLFSTIHRSVWSWDGRHGSLEAQLLAPFVAPAEMANDRIETVLEKLRKDKDYALQFRMAYDDDRIDAGRLADALRAFVARLDEPTRFERFVAGDHDLLTDEETEGLHLFRNKAGCANCHFGPLLSDDRFHNLGLSAFGETSQDLGRYAVSGKMDDIGRFRTPSLRHVARTAPYMHNGHFTSLEGVVNFYARGGGDVWLRNEAEENEPLRRAAATLSPHLRPLDLDEAERRALVAFLRAL